MPRQPAVERDAVFSADGRRSRTPIYDGSRLGAGAQIAGPAVIEEETTSIVIVPGWTARLDRSASYPITRAAAAVGAGAA